MFPTATLWIVCVFTMPGMKRISSVRSFPAGGFFVPTYHDLFMINIGSCFTLILPVQRISFLISFLGKAIRSPEMASGS